MSGSPGLLGRALASLRLRKDALITLLAALLLAVALLSPSVPVTRAQVDAVAVIDITQSMNVPDQTIGGKPVSRLSFAKAKLDRMLSELPCGSRLGWAIFTEYRSFLLLAPLEVCEHQRELRATLQGIDGRMAWAGGSEVAKGINSGMEMVQALEDRPAVVFFTDGQESPPVNPSYRPSFTVARGAVKGLVVGVGGDVALAIPKLDPEGRPQGDWSASDVLQVDPYSLGRGGSVAGEQLVDSDGSKAKPMLGATPGSEHLSALREEYLRLLAGETGLAYLRLENDAALAAALRAPKMTRDAVATLDLGPWLGSAALFCLVVPVLISVWTRLRNRRRSAHATRTAPVRSSASRAG
jgi:mxaL protein